MSKTIELRKCEVCGGSLASADGGILRCNYCGADYYFSEDKNEALVISLNRAAEYRRICDFDSAIVEYKAILETHPNDSEANWGMFISLCGIEYVKDERTGTHIPTCHRTIKSNLLENKYYKAAVKNADKKQAELYEAQAKLIAKLQKKIMQQMEDEEDFEVFISFKAQDKDGHPTEDSVIARNIYDKLNAAGIKTFFSPVTLRNHLGDEYEPIIYKAIYTCKYFILVSTSEEHTNAIWVKNEWARFRDRMSDENMSDGNGFAVFRGKDSIPQFMRSRQGFDLSAYPNGGYEIAVVDFVTMYLRGTGNNATETAAPAPAAVIETPKDYAADDFVIRNHVLIKYTGQSKDVVIPSVVTKIGEDAFFNCEDIVSISIPNSVTEIGDSAFEGCQKLKSLNIPERVKKIGSSAFAKCCNLVSINIPSGIKNIESGTFMKCQRLTNITLPNGITTIGAKAFSGCESLSSLILPEKLSYISDNLFAGCLALESVIIPDTVTKIGEYAFEDCKKLCRLSLPNSISQISENSFKNCGNLTIKLYGAEFSGSNKYGLQRKIKEHQKNLAKNRETLINILISAIPFALIPLTLLLQWVIGLWAMVLIGIEIALGSFCILRKFSYYIPEAITVIVHILLTILGIAFIFITRETSFIALPLIVLNTILSFFTIEDVEFSDISLAILIINAIFASIGFFISIVWLTIWGTSPYSIYKNSIEYNLDRTEGTFIALPYDDTTILKATDAPNAEKIVIGEGFKEIIDISSSLSTSYKEIYIPSSVTTISGGAFSFISVKTLYIGYNEDGTPSNTIPQLKSFGANNDDADVETIYFNGTIEQWNSIEIEPYEILFDTFTDLFESSFTVICNDGTLEYE